MAERALLTWLRDPVSDRGIHFARAGDAWELWAYDRLADHARRAAAGLIEYGVGADDVIALIADVGPDLVGTFFGAMIAGAIPTLVPPPVKFEQLGPYRKRLTAMLAGTRAKFAVVPRAHRATIVPMMPSGMAVVAEELFEHECAPTDRATSSTALIQFTSGTTGAVRGVRVTFDALEANLESIRKWLSWTEADVFASWLPLYHDMGLVGGLIGPIVRRNALWLLEPEQFIRRPVRYLRCLSASTLSAMPAFGLDLLTRRVRPEHLQGCDFSRVRGIVVGAERLEARGLERFERLFAPFGLRGSAVLPAYGMAEATLAITGLRPGPRWRALSVSPASLSPGQSIAVDDEGPHVVGCGRPLDGVCVLIVDQVERPLPERHVGEIAVRGALIATDIVDDQALTATRFVRGTLYTGDAGFIEGGELFVLGRIGDSMKVRGRVVFGEEVEIALAALGVVRHRVAVALGVHLGVPTAVIVLEAVSGVLRQSIEAVVPYHTAGAKMFLFDAPIGTIQRTSSGKPKRRDLWRAFVTGTLSGTAIAARGGDS